MCCFRLTHGPVPHHDATEDQEGDGDVSAPRSVGKEAVCESAKTQTGIKVKTPYLVKMSYFTCVKCLTRNVLLILNVIL